jgi:hypothetical protein
MNAIDWPARHPGRFTTSCTREIRLGVRWLDPEEPVELQDGGDHGTAAAVRARVEMLREVSE